MRSLGPNSVSKALVASSASTSSSGRARPSRRRARQSAAVVELMAAPVVSVAACWIATSRASLFSAGRAGPLASAGPAHNTSGTRVSHRQLPTAAISSGPLQEVEVRTLITVGQRVDAAESEQGGTDVLDGHLV